jgi:hypothetical protein
MITIKAFCSDGSIHHIEYEHKHASNETIAKDAFMFASNNLYIIDDEYGTDIRKVERILVHNNVWFEVDSIHRYPCYGVDFGDKFACCEVSEGQYILMHGDTIHDDLWSDDNGYFSAVFDTIDEAKEYCGDNDWIGAVVDGEIIAIKGGNHEN